MKLQDLMQYCRNYFSDTDNTITGDITIEHGKVKADILQNYRFYLIEGSHYNDGVYEADTTALRDEVFSGTVTPLCPPPDFVELAERISEWETKYKEAMYKPFQSESFDGYSYTKATGPNGKQADWRTVWSAEINRYRKI